MGDPDEFSVTVSGEGADLVPTDEDNLAVRAAKLLAATHGPHDSLGVSLRIKKDIPVAGGLAGGSSNAAAALLACAVLWDLDVSPEGMQSTGCRARERRAVRAARRHRGRARTGRGGDAGAGSRQLSLGAGVRPSRAFHARRSTGTSTS